MLKQVDSGHTAQKAGKAFQESIGSALEHYGYTYISTRNIMAGRVLRQPLYCLQYNIKANLYENPQGTNIDVVIFSPEASENWQLICVELKTQRGGGTADEKLPFSVLNILQNYPHKTILILEGAGFRKGAVLWCKKQENGRLIRVCDFGEFSALARKHFC